MISQLTVFLANEKGRLAAACRTLADADINMKALFIADTADFGIVRIFCDTPARAVEVLGQAGFRASLTPVIAVSVEDAPGTLHRRRQGRRRAEDRGRRCRGGSRRGGLRRSGSGRGLLR